MNNEGHIELEYSYKPHQSLGTQERNPLVVAWTTLPQTTQHAPAFHRHLLPMGAKASVRVSFPFDSSQAWHQDACVRFLLMTQIQSSEKQWTYAKTASTEVYLADLLSKSSGATNGMSEIHIIPMRVQAYYMPPPGKTAPALVEAERHKGDLHVRLVKQSRHNIQWHPSSHLDVTPANTGALQSAMMLSVNRGMSPFDAGISGGTAIAPTLPEIENVHAPFYVQETPVPLDGATFWSRVPDVARQHVAHHGGQQEAHDYLDVLLRQSLARHNMSKERFLRTGNNFSSRRVTDSDKLTAVAVIATMCTMRVNMMRYVADKAVLAKSKEAVVVESFDQVDMRTADATDTGGVVSRDIGGGFSFAGNVWARGGSDAAGADVAVGGAMDCEDGARDAAVHFSLLSDPGAGIPDDSISSSIVRAARNIAQHYRAVGFLSSVLSRNLNDAKTTAPQSDDNGQERTPPIGSVQDQRVQVGAHMFTLLFPKRVLATSIYRGMDLKRVPRTRLDLGDPQDPLATPSPLSRGQELPVALCEGTGMLHPLMLPKEAYASDVNVKLAKAVSSVLEQEAQVRLRTAKTSDELVQAQSASSSASPTLVVPAALDLFGPMHTQDRILDDPNQRIVSTFYRTAAEGYVVPTSQQLAQRRRAQRGTPNKRLVGDRLIPIQIGSPRRSLWRPQMGQTYKKVSANSGRSSNNNQRTITWGLAVSDMLRNRSFVGFLPTPEPLFSETQIVDRVHAHVAPAVALHLDKDLGSDHYIQSANRWVTKTNTSRRIPSVSQALARLNHDLGKQRVQEQYVLAHGYAHPRDLTDQNMDGLLRWLHNDNPHVVGISLHLEQSTYRLAMLRLDTLIDCGNTAKQIEPRLAQQIRSRAITVRTPARPRPIGCPIKGRRHQRGLFEEIMLQHIELTAHYVVLSWRNRHKRTNLPMDHPAVQALVDQFQDWGNAIDEGVSEDALRQYERIWNRLTDRRYIMMPSPGSLWVSQLILNHTVYIKALADAAWYPNDSRQRMLKQKALDNVTGLNNSRIATFWASLVPPGGPGRTLGMEWQEHLKCTAKYIETLARTADPAPHSEFDEDVMQCLTRGAAFGKLLDRYL